MLKATGLRYPGRVVGAGGIYLELDTREVPNVATVVAERPQVTFDSSIKDEVIKTDLTAEALAKNDTTYLHFKNWLDAMEAGRPDLCNNTPDLGAAAIVTVILGAMSYRNGKVYHFDAATGTYSDGNPGWAKKWEAMSKARAKPKHVPGWHAGDTGSVLKPEEHQSLGGPWVGGKDPAGA